MEILNDVKNDLLKRQEVIGLVVAEKNPGFVGMKKTVSEKFDKPEEVLDVYNIKGSFGSHEFKVYAYIYDSKEDLEKALLNKKRDVKAKGSVESSAPVEEKPEQIEEKPESKPTEAPVEERPEEESKAVEEGKKAEEESKEP